MKSKIFKCAMMSMLFLLTIFSIQNVHAEQYAGSIYEAEWISNIYVKKDISGMSKYQQARFIRRSNDGQFVYCVEPLSGIDNSIPYEVIRSNYNTILNFSPEQWERISLLAYYGYQYNENGYNHNDQKWYAITQLMIWRTARPDIDIYFTDSLNGNRVSRFENEMAEIESLVSNHYRRPNLESNITLPIGSSITLEDSNNVLNRFTVSDSSNVNATINGNSITITATGIGDASISLKKTATKYEIPPIVYINPNSQNVVAVGNYDPVYSKLNFKVIGGKVKTNKVDVETRTNTPQGEAKLSGAIYGIYKNDGTKVGTITTSEDGTVTSDYLPELGRFYLLEEQPSEGYRLDSNKYYFDITEDNLNPEVQVYEQVIKLDFEFTKVYASSKTGIMTPEVGIKFGIYNNKNELVEEVTTDSQGVFRFTLPYGTYTVKQLTSTKGHEKVEDFTVEVKTTGEVVKKVISNAPITAKLRVVKIDSETKEVIKRSNIKFKIFDVNKNEYVCQTITYPNKKTICEWETDKNGEFTTAYPLMTGTYRLEEVDQVIDGYLWNQESHEFIIDENSTLRTDSDYGIIFDTQFENQRVKGEIKINKVGEKAELTEEGYTFITEPLEGVKFCVYTKNGKEVQCGLTGTDGVLIFTNLDLGSYNVVEVETLEGYVLDTTKHEVVLKYKDQYTPVITYETLIENKIPTGKLIFTKTDFSESKTLPNTLIEIYDEENNKVFSGRTSENGEIIIDRLPVGKYKLYEKEAPEGYQLNPEAMEFEIKENGEIVKCNMKDEQIVNVPNTEAKDYKELLFSGITLLICGAGFIVYGIKKKNKK